MSSNRNALDVLMNSAKKTGSSKKRPIAYVPCPSCGAQVSERDINDHLDRCLMSSVDGNDGAASASAASNEHDVQCPSQAVSGTCAPGVLAETSTAKTSTKEPINKRGRIACCTPQSQRSAYPHETPALPATRSSPKNNDAFSHMMKRSAAVFSKSGNGEHLIRQRFHLHNAEGLVTWSSEDDSDKNDASNATTENANSESLSPPKKSGDEILEGDIHWSAVITMNKVKSIDVDDCPSKQQQALIDMSNSEKVLELTISSSLPAQEEKEKPLVSRHSRLSVSRGVYHDNYINGINGISLYACIPLKCVCRRIEDSTIT